MDKDMCDFCNEREVASKDEMMCESCLREFNKEVEECEREEIRQDLDELDKRMQELSKNVAIAARRIRNARAEFNERDGESARAMMLVSLRGTDKIGESLQKVVNKITHTYPKLCPLREGVNT